MRRGSGTSGTTFKCSNIQIIRCQKEKSKSKKLKTYFEQIMKENFPNLAKEIDYQEVQEPQRVPKKVDSRKQQEERRELPTKEFP